MDHDRELIRQEDIFVLNEEIVRLRHYMEDNRSRLSLDDLAALGRNLEQLSDELDEAMMGPMPMAHTGDEVISILSNREDAMQGRPQRGFVDHYANTSLAQERTAGPVHMLPYGQRAGLSYDDGQSDDEDEESQPNHETLIELGHLGFNITDGTEDDDEDSFEARQAARQDALQRQRDEALDRRCDDKWQELLAYRVRRDFLENSFKQSLSMWNTEDEETCQAFRRHAIYAAAYSDAEVRTFDIMRWWTKMPDHVQESLRELTKYFHKEAKLEYDAKHFEMDCGNVPLCSEKSGGPNEHWMSDKGYAAERFGKADYGWEANQHRNSFHNYRPRAEFKGRQAILHVRAGFETRKVRFQQTDEQIAFDKRIDQKIRVWINEATEYLRKAQNDILQGLSEKQAKELKDMINKLNYDMAAFDVKMKGHRFALNVPAATDQQTDVSADQQTASERAAA